MKSKKNFDKKGTPVITEEVLSELSFLLKTVDINEFSKSLRQMVLRFIRLEFDAGGDFDLLVIDHLGKIEYLFTFLDKLEQFQAE